MEASQETKFMRILSKEIIKSDISADLAAMDEAERLAYKAWVKQIHEENRMDIWREKRNKRAEAFARKFGVGVKP